jgi:hypothetical protein
MQANNTLPVQGPALPANAPTPEAIAKCEADYNKTVEDAGKTRDACKTGTPSKKGAFGLGFFGLGGKKSKSQKNKKGGKKSRSQKNKDKRGGKKSRSQKKR